MSEEVQSEIPRSVLIIPWWPHSASENERVSLESINRFAGGAERVVVSPSVSCVPPIMRISRVEVFPESCFTDAWTYSKLLSTVDFYERFERYEQLIVVQSDVLLLRSLDPLAGKRYPASYVGAPWITREPTGALRLDGVGNGGFSLRRTQDFLDVLRSPTFPSWPRFTTVRRGMALWALLACCFLARFKGERIAHLLIRRSIHEDVFWSKVAPCLSARYKVASQTDAVAFSYEAFPRFAHQVNHGQLPYGIHGWWRHDADFVRSLSPV